MDLSQEAMEVWDWLYAHYEDLAPPVVQDMFMSMPEEQVFDFQATGGQGLAPEATV